MFQLERPLAMVLHSFLHQSGRLRLQPHRNLTSPRISAGCPHCVIPSFDEAVAGQKYHYPSTWDHRPQENLSCSVASCLIAHPICELGSWRICNMAFRLRTGRECTGWCVFNFYQAIFCPSLIYVKLSSKTYQLFQ